MSTPRPAGPGPRRLHLDLHPLNLLVSDDGELTGVLDGPNAAAGHPDLDRARTWSILTLDPIARSYRSQPVFAALAEAWLEQGQLARASPAARGRSPTPPGRAASARSNTRPALPARQPPAGAAPRPPASPLTCAFAGESTVGGSAPADLPRRYGPGASVTAETNASPGMNAVANTGPITRSMAPLTGRSPSYGAIDHAAAQADSAASANRPDSPANLRPPFRSARKQIVGFAALVGRHTRLAVCRLLAGAGWTRP